MSYRGKQLRLFDAWFKELDPSELSVLGVSDDGEFMRLLIVSESFQDMRLCDRYRTCQGLLEKGDAEYAKWITMMYTAVTKAEWEAKKFGATEDKS